MYYNITLLYYKITLLYYNTSINLNISVFITVDIIFIYLCEFVIVQGGTTRIVWRICIVQMLFTFCILFSSRNTRFPGGFNNWIMDNLLLIHKRKVWRYQKSNQKLYIDGQTMQRSKENRTKGQIMIYNTLNSAIGQIRWLGCIYYTKGTLFRSERFHCTVL